VNADARPVPPLDADQVVVGRQPITDRSGTVVAYELLHRYRHVRSVPLDGDRMTVEVVLGALSIGLDQLVGDKVMFCNAERSVLTGETPVSLPPGRTVIEVLESVLIDDEVVDGCRRLVEAGFRLALDDFVWVPGAERLLELAHVVKLDVLAMTRTEVLALVQRCRPFDVRLLAEKVETADDLSWAMDAGFDYFQGYAIERPAVVHGRTIGASAAAQVDLALSMLTEDLDLDALEETLRREPGLVVQVLQLASYGANRGLRREVHTVREALMLLGTARIRQWIALTVLGSRPAASPDGLVTALCRARMAELLAPSRGVQHAEVAFTAGLLSALDLLLGVPLSELETTLDLDPGLKAAAIRREGPLGRLVAEVADYQEGLLGGEVTDEARRAELDAVAADAFAWAMPFVSGLSA
jgi:c-di-GMP-related signal transduction protein